MPGVRGVTLAELSDGVLTGSGSVAVSLWAGAVNLHIARHARLTPRSGCLSQPLLSVCLEVPAPPELEKVTRPRHVLFEATYGALMGSLSPTTTVTSIRTAAARAKN